MMRFYICTLGCKVNTYESNVVHDLLCNASYIPVKQVEEADILILNTCTVTNTADSKSLKMIRQMKRKNPHACMVVMGCLVQTGLSKIPMEQVDICIGNQNKTKIVSFIEEYYQTCQKIVDHHSLEQAPFEIMCLNNFDKTRAFVKIQDGCNNFCSYCIIPYSRGTVRSKPSYLVLDEVQGLIRKGHHEIVLTGIHTGNYGVEFENYDFACLLKDLVVLPGLERLRISSIEITELHDQVLDIIRHHSVLVDHMHIPLQSGCDKILKAMNRKYDVAYFEQKISQIRSIRPRMSITTDVIVGFPGESDEDFETTLQAIEKIGFSKIHVFPYSKRENTVASTMSDQVEEKVKKERVIRLLALSKKLELAYMNQFVGMEVTYLPESYQDGYAIGHTDHYLLVKHKCEKMENGLVTVTIQSLHYPYVLAS